MESIKPQYDWVEQTELHLVSSQRRPGQAAEIRLVRKRTGKLWNGLWNRKIEPAPFVRKTISCDTAESARNVQREVKIIKKFRHPNVLTYVDFEYISKYSIARLYTPYAPNGDLGIFLPGGIRYGDFNEAYARCVAKQISSALVNLHYGLIVTLNASGQYDTLELADNLGFFLHRDIKPANSAILCYVALGRFTDHLQSL